MKSQNKLFSLILVLLLFTSQYAWLVKAEAATQLTVNVTDAASKPIQNAQVSIEKWSPWLGFIPRWELKYAGTTDVSGKYLASINETGSFRATASYSGSSKISEPFEVPGVTSVTLKIENYVTSTITITVLDAQRAPRGGGQVKLEHITKFVGLVPYSDFTLEGTTDASGTIQWKEWVPAGNYRLTIMWPGTSEGDLYDTKDLVIAGDLTLVFISRYAWFYAPIAVETVGISSSYGIGDWSMQNNWAGVQIQRTSQKLIVTTQDGITLEYQAQWVPFEDTFYGQYQWVPVKYEGSFDKPWIQIQNDWPTLGVVNTTCFPVLIQFEGHEQLIWFNMISYKSMLAKIETRVFLIAAIVGFLAICIATGGTAGFAASIATGVIPLILSTQVTKGIYPNMSWSQMLAKIEETGGRNAADSVNFFIENFKSNGALARSLESPHIDAVLLANAAGTALQQEGIFGGMAARVTTWLDRLGSLRQTIQSAITGGLPRTMSPTITTAEGTTFSLHPNDFLVFTDGSAKYAHTLDSYFDEGMQISQIQWEGFGPQAPFESPATVHVNSGFAADAIKGTRDSGVLGAALDEAGATDVEKAAVIQQSINAEEASRQSGSALGHLADSAKRFIANYPKFSEMSKVSKFFAILGLAFTAYSLWEYFTFIAKQSDKTVYCGLVIDVTPFSLTIGGLARIWNYGVTGGGWYPKNNPGTLATVKLVPLNAMAGNFSKYGSGTQGGLVLSQNGLLYAINSAHVQVGENYTGSSSGGLYNEGPIEALSILKVTPNVPPSSTEWKQNFGMATKTILLGAAYSSNMERQLEAPVSVESPYDVREVMRSRGGIWQADVAGDAFVITWGSTGKFYAPVAISNRGTISQKFYVEPKEVKVYWALVQLENKAPLAAIYLPEPQGYNVQVRLSAKEVITSADYINHLIPSIPIFGPLFGQPTSGDWWKDQYGNYWSTDWWNPNIKNATWISYLGALWDETFGTIGKGISDAFKGLGDWFMNLIGVPEWLRPIIGWLVLLALIIILLLAAIFLWPLFVWLLKLIWLLIKFALALIATFMLAIPFIIVYLIDFVAGTEYHETISGWIGGSWDWVLGREEGED